MLDCWSACGYIACFSGASLISCDPGEKIFTNLPAGRHQAGLESGFGWISYSGISQFLINLACSHKWIILSILVMCMIHLNGAGNCYICWLIGFENNLQVHVHDGMVKSQSNNPPNLDEIAVNILYICTFVLCFCQLHQLDQHVIDILDNANEPVI